MKQTDRARECLHDNTDQAIQHSIPKPLDKWNACPPERVVDMLREGFQMHRDADMHAIRYP